MVLFDEELVLGLGFWFKEWPFQTLESGPKQQKNGQKSLFEGRKKIAWVTKWGFVGRAFGISKWP